MEAELIESSEMDSKTDNLAVTEEADVDEAIPIYLKNNKTHIHIKIKWTLILIRLTHMNQETK